MCPPIRHVFLVQVMALIGTGLARVALALLAHNLAEGQAGAVRGAALAIKMVAYVVISPTGRRLCVTTASAHLIG